MSDEFESLTNARLNVWKAIDSFDATRGLFNKTFRFDGESTLIEDLTPGFADLDCLWIMPSGTVPKWFVNTRQTLLQSLVLVMFTRDWNVPKAENYTLRLMAAIHRAKPVNGAPYVREPKIGPNVTTRLTKIDPDDNPIKCVKTTLELVLPVQFQPYV